MQETRLTLEMPAGALHMMDGEGDRFQRFLDFKDNQLDADDLHNLQQNVAPGWMWHIIDADFEQPDGFVFSHYDKRCQLHDLTGTTLADFNDEKYVVDLRKSYLAVRKTCLARFTQETILSGCESRSFLRIINPLVFSGRQRQLLIATRYQDPSRSIEIAEHLEAPTCEQIKQALVGPEVSLERAISSEFILELYRRVSVGVLRDTGINNLLERLANDPINILLDRDSLSECCKAPG